MKRFVKSGILWAVVLAVCLQAFGMFGCAKKAVLPPSPAEYSVTASAVGNGTVSVSASSVSEGNPVTFTATPERGYVLERLVVNGAEVNTVRDTYTVVAVLRDLTAKAYFEKPEVVVEGYDGEKLVLTAERRVGGAVGQLASPHIAGKRVLYWTYDGSGERMLPTDTIERSGTIKLNAVTETVPTEEKERLQPYSVAATYYDAAATKYGVTFHTDGEPITPVALVAQKPSAGDYDWDNAVIVDAEYDPWLGEYVSSCVIDGLEFGTEYAVKVGDYAADKYSGVYEFKTRESVLTDAKFFFVSDSQQSGLSADLGRLHGYDPKHGQNIGAGKTYYSETLRAARERFPDAQFVLHGGDFVDDGSVPAYWRDMLSSLDGTQFALPTLAASGNHEGVYYHVHNGTVFNDQTDRIFNVNSVRDGISGMGDGSYYSFDYGPAHIVVLRSEDTLHDWQNGLYIKEQFGWLENDLKAVDRNVTPWVVVLAHKPVITALDPHLNPQLPRGNNTYKQIMPLLTSYNVDLFLYGHNHLLEISNPLVWDKEATAGTKIDYNGGTSLTWEYVRPSEFTGGTVDVGDDTVKTFSYASGFEGKRGTVFHQIACAGPQYRSPSDPANTLSYTRGDLVANIAKTNGLWNCLLSAASIDETDPANPENTKYQALTGEYYGGENYKGYSMYDYIEISKTSLTCRSYGVDVYGLATSGGGQEDHTVYVDGFRLQK